MAKTMPWQYFSWKIEMVRKVTRQGISSDKNSPALPSTCYVQPVKGQFRWQLPIVFVG
jgi:hypothetical protein